MYIFAQVWHAMMVIFDDDIDYCDDDDVDIDDIDDINDIDDDGIDYYKIILDAEKMDEKIVDFNNVSYYNHKLSIYCIKYYHHEALSKIK